ncbi:MAG: PAS domain-containing protein, partial [Clostridia bacterium]|nr:PAS domain-containing protein [Clostridia bacterium]
VEYRIVGKDGEIRWVEDHGHFVHSKAGDIFYVFISDATEKVTRLMVERAALVSAEREKEQKLQNLIEEYDKERKLIRQEHLQRLEVIEGLSVNYESILYADLDTDTVLPYRLSSRLERQFEQKLQVRGLGWFLR